MESTEKQVKTTASDSLIFKCAICGNDCCSRCEGRNQYWNGFLCNSCYNSFHIRSTTRIKKIKQKRELRNQYPPFSFEIKRSLYLKIGLDALTSIDSEGYLFMSDKGLKFFCLDPSRIYSSELKIPEEELDIITTPKKEQVIYLDLDGFKAALDSLSESEKFLFQRIRGDANLLIKPLNTQKTITISPLEPDESPIYTQKLHEIEYHASFFIEKEKLIEILENSQNFSEHFTLTCTKKRVIFAAEGKTTNYKYEFLSDELEDYTWEKDSKNMYTTEWILPFIKRLVETTETIKIFNRTEMPLTLNINSGQALFYIAPRVSHNEEEDD